MNFELTEEQLMVLETASQFAQDHIAPYAAAFDEGRELDTYLANLKELGSLGFLSMGVSEAYGGSNLGTVAFSLAITELAKVCASTATAVSVTNMVAEVIQAIGTEAQKGAYLPRFSSGELAAASFCLSESEAGSDPSAMKTTATQCEEGWVLNGSKMWISSAPYAGLFIVWAVTDKEADRGRGISCFVVEPNLPGIEVDQPERKMGLNASATCRVTFDNCVLDKSALLGELNNGYRIAVGELCGGRIGIGSLALGLAKAAFDYAASYAAQRRQFGQNIIDFQGVQWMLAEAHGDLEATQLLINRAAWLKELGRPFAVEASVAKLKASEAANEICNMAIQLCGGLGYTKDAPLERFARDARVTTIYEGTSEVQKVIIGRDLVNRYSVSS